MATMARYNFPAVDYDSLWAKSGFADGDKVQIEHEESNSILLVSRMPGISLRWPSSCNVSQPSRSPTLSSHSSANYN